MQYPKNCGKTVGNNPAEQGTIPHFCFENKEKHPKSHDFECIFGCGGGICWPWQKHSRIGHSAQLVPDTPCFFSCRTRFTVHRARSRSKLTPSSGGRSVHIPHRKRKKTPDWVSFRFWQVRPKKISLKILTILSFSFWLEQQSSVRFRNITQQRG